MRSRTHTLCLLLILVFIALALPAVPAFAATSGLYRNVGGRNQSL